MLTGDYLQSGGPLAGCNTAKGRGDPFASLQFVCGSKVNSRETEVKDKNPWEKL